MIHKVKMKYTRLAPRKAIPIARLLKGLSLDEAMARTAVNKTKAGKMLFELLKSARSNLEQTHKVAPETFRIVKCVVEQGPQIKRYWPRSRGMVHPISKKTAHLIIELENSIKLQSKIADTVSAVSSQTESRKE